MIGTAQAAQEGLAMSTFSGKKGLSAILSIVTVGAALSFGVGIARAGDNNVTEDQIVRALAPEKKPLTRGLSVGPQADPAATAAKLSMPLLILQGGRDYQVTAEDLQRFQAALADIRPLTTDLRVLGTYPSAV